MHKTLTTLAIALLLMGQINAQKRVLSYDFQFQYQFMTFRDHEAYFLELPKDSVFALTLKDSKKIEYILIDKKFKVVANVGTKIKSSAVSGGFNEYAGGTADGKRFNFIYQNKNDFFIETAAKTIDSKKLFELPKTEESIVSFTDNNVQYSLAANNKTSELSIYRVDNLGQYKKIAVPFNIPAEASRKRDKLSEYLSDVKVFRSNEYPDLSNSLSSAKIFCSENKLEFVINDGDNPVRIVTLSIPDFTFSEKFLKFDEIVSKDERGKLYVTSYLKDDKLFSLVLNKRNIRIVLQDANDGKLLSKFEINDDSDPNMFLEGPYSETRKGNRAKEKEVKNTNKLIRALTKGTEGLYVTQNKKGDWVVTAGTHDLLKMGSGSSGGTFRGGVSTSMTNHGGPMGNSYYDPYKYYVPGRPGYTYTNARYYTSTYFKMLIDSSTYKIGKGRGEETISDQIKDYMESIEQKARATNQFGIGKKQYFGYYSPEEKMYIVEQIFVK